MIKKVKDWLGIEGVKIRLDVPDGQVLGTRVLRGSIVFESLQQQEIEAFRIKLVESYARGRGQERRVDEYTLGKKQFNQKITVGPDSAVTLSFELPFEPQHAPIDEWGNRNAINAQLAKLARWSRNAVSTFHLEAEAKVKGVALSPFQKIEITLA